MGWLMKTARAEDGTRHGKRQEQQSPAGQAGGGAASFVRKAGSALLRLTGLGSGIAFIRCTAGALAGRQQADQAEQGIMQRIKALLYANLLHEDDLLKGSFASVLACWGLAEEDLPCAVKNLGREALCGAVLLLVSLCALAGAFLLPVPFAFLRFFAAAASASMALAGLLLLLASLWRRSVLQKRHFVSFTTWLSFADWLSFPGRRKIPKNPA